METQGISLQQKARSEKTTRTSAALQHTSTLCPARAGNSSVDANELNQTARTEDERSY